MNSKADQDKINCGPECDSRMKWCLLSARVRDISEQDHLIGEGVSIQSNGLYWY